jgi:hypothetical protein
MRTKLIALIVLCAAIATATVAQAAPVTIALYSFETAGDVAAFQKARAGKCEKKWQQMKQMAIQVGAGTNSCVFSSSVAGDSTDPLSDMDVASAANLGAGVGKKLQKKAYVGVGARQSETSGWEFRIRPGAQTWQLFRDPKGAAPSVLLRSGKGRFIKGAGKKPNQLSLRTFDFSTPTTTITAIINGKTVASLTDAAADSPDGRRSVVLTGVKGSGSGGGVVGIFDNVAIRVPSPF